MGQYSYGEFWSVVRALCALYGASVTGGPRSSARNATVGGAPRSRHLLEHGGKAADLVPDDWSQAPALAADAVRLGLWSQVDESETKGRHVHVHDEP